MKEIIAHIIADIMAMIIADIGRRRVKRMRERGKKSEARGQEKIG